MKKILKEFKEFVSRGNVIDLSVGVIVGGAFTAIVTALTTNIFKPLINWLIYLIFGNKEGLQGVYTILVGSGDDLSNAIYIDWGALISSIINFFLIALILFIIVKSMNKLKGEKDKVIKNILTREDIKTLKQKGIKITDSVKVKEYLKEKEELEKEELKKVKEQEEKERMENPTELDVLKEIKELLKNKNN